MSRVNLKVISKVNYKIFGCTLMLLGTCIGAGMLALPLAAAQYNYYVTIGYMFASWLLMTIGAFALLEVNLWMSSGSNLFTMSKNTLGKYGNFFSLIIYLLLLYSLISAYIAASSDILQGFLHSYNINLSHISSTLLVSVVLASIVILGIRIIDLTNRVLMAIKVSALGVILYLMLSKLDSDLITLGAQASYEINSIMVMITAFGFAIIIPSLREYLEDDHKALACTLLIGCMIPFVLYSLWVLAVHGVLPKSTPDGLIAISNSENANTDLINSISNTMGSPLLTRIISVFVSISVVTSFLGVALCLVDFLRDIVKNLYLKFYFEAELDNKLEPEHNKSLVIREIVVYILAFSVPLLIVLLNPGLFILALSYAGNLVLIFLVILPLLMLYLGRYHQNYVGRSYLPGGKILILFSLLLSIIILAKSIFDLIF